MAVAGHGSETPAGETASTGASGETGASGPAASTYSHACDGSAAAMVGSDYFVSFNDEDQRALLFAVSGGAPVATFPLDLGTTKEADLEDAARVGSRVYVVSSHGRNSSGELKRARHQFFALDLLGTAPLLDVALDGRSEHLLDDLLDKDNWQTPSDELDDILDDASQLAKATVADLAPEKNGISIEGLGHWPSAAYPERLAIGLRNPRWNNKAILVTLLNPSAVVTGQKARFGEGYALDLGGLGIRSLLWSAERESLLVLAGPADGAAGPFRVYAFDGASGGNVKAVEDLPAAAGSPEALLLGRVLLDQGDVDGCKAKLEADRTFSELLAPSLR